MPSRRRAAKGCQVCRRSRNDDIGREGTIMSALSKTGKEYDMNINVKKTRKIKGMRVCRNGCKREGGNSVNKMIEGQWVEQVNQFCYLESRLDKELDRNGQEWI